MIIIVVGQREFEEMLISGRYFNSLLPLQNPRRYSLFYFGLSDTCQTLFSEEIVMNKMLG